MVNVERLCDGPIVGPETHPSIGDNIQGPSLIRVPDWVENPLGRYYLYFADHKGTYIRLAYADALTGPWQVHAPGSLHLKNSLFPTEPPPVPADGPARVLALGLTSSALQALLHCLERRRAPVTIVAVNSIGHDNMLVDTRLDLLTARRPVGHSGRDADRHGTIRARPLRTGG